MLEYLRTIFSNATNPPKPGITSAAAENNSSIAEQASSSSSSGDKKRHLCLFRLSIFQNSFPRNFSLPNF
jgi:hypothetical protein